MRLEIEKRLPNHRVFWVDSDAALVTKGYTVLRLIGNSPATRLGHYAAPRLDRMLSRVRLLRHGLRLGFHNLWPLPDGSLVGIVKKTLLKLSVGSTQFRKVGRLRWGNKPGLKGMCVDEAGLVYYGEYAQNMHRSHSIGLFRSDDGGESYRLIHEFPAGQVRHIHFVQWDPYARCLWVGTGDRDSECLLLRSDDRGEHWELIGSGSQLWRAVGVAFTPEAVFWGMDAGSDTGTTPNFIVRFNRATRQATRVKEVQGPCHGTGLLHNGTLLVSTGVEGGANEKDRSAHLWASRDGDYWEEIASWRKDVWPNIVQFGVVHFPHNMAAQSQVHTTLRAIAGAPEAYLRAGVAG